ncbi:MAG: MFS transporter [Chloroflexota bacterium]
MEVSTNWKRRITAFLISQGITLFGSSLVQMAIIWHVTLETSSGKWVAALTLSAFVPQMVISLFAGVLADRYNRKYLIIAADVGIAVATLILFLFLITNNSSQNNLISILIISIVRSLGAGIQSPAVSSIVPQLVPEEKLIRINGINGSLQSIIQFGAPAAAGVILTTGSFSNILLIDIITAMVGIVILFFIDIPGHNVVEMNVQSGIFKEMKSGIQFAMNDKLIGRLLLIYGVFIFLCIPSGFLTPLLIGRLFGYNYMYLSVNEMIGCAGMALGGLLIGIWGGFNNRIKTLAFGIGIYAAFSIALGLLKDFIGFAIIIFIMSLAIPIAQTAVITLLQEKVAPDMQGRVFSLLSIMFTGFLPLGMLVFGPLADTISISSMIMVAGTLLILFSISIPVQKDFFALGIFNSEIETLE